MSVGFIADIPHKYVISTKSTNFQLQDTRFLSSAYPPCHFYRDVTEQITAAHDKALNEMKWKL